MRPHRCTGDDCGICAAAIAAAELARQEPPTDAEIQDMENAYEASLDRLGGSL